jgi:hypothetical protein
MAESNLAGTGRAGSPPLWLVRAVDDLVGCALDPGCAAWDCRADDPAGHHPSDPDLHGVVGPDKAYLCTRCLRLAFASGAIEPCSCVRCGRAPGVHMGSSRAAGTGITIWFRVCAACRSEVDRELGRAA